MLGGPTTSQLLLVPWLEFHLDTTHHSVRRPSLPPTGSLDCPIVFVHQDGHMPLLSAPYASPYPILAWSLHPFCLRLVAAGKLCPLPGWSGFRASWDCTWRWGHHPRNHCQIHYLLHPNRQSSSFHQEGQGRSALPWFPLSLGLSHLLRPLHWGGGGQFLKMKSSPLPFVNSGINMIFVLQKSSWKSPMHWGITF